MLIPCGWQVLCRCKAARAGAPPPVLLPRWGKQLAWSAGFVCFQGCSEISRTGILSRLELLFSTVYGSKSSKSAWLQTNHVKSQLCTGKASSQQERFQAAEYNNMKAKYCYLLNAWRGCHCKWARRNTLRSREVPDPRCDRRPAIRVVVFTHVCHGWWVCLCTHV